MCFLTEPIRKTKNIFSIALLIYVYLLLATFNKTDIIQRREEAQIANNQQCDVACPEGQPGKNGPPVSKKILLGNFLLMSL